MMDDEDPKPGPFDALARPGLLEYRLMVQEKRGDNQELRMQMIEKQYISMAADLRSVGEDTGEIKTYLKEAIKKDEAKEESRKDAGKRNLWALGVATVTVILTVISTHVLWH